MRGDTVGLAEGHHEVRQRAALSLLVAGTSGPPAVALTRLVKGLGDGGATVTLACGLEPDALWFVPPRFRWLPVRPSPRLARIRPVGFAWMAGRAVLRGPADAWRFWCHQRRVPTLARRLRAWRRLSPFAGHRWDVIYFPDPEAALALRPLFDIGRPVVVSAFDGPGRNPRMLPLLTIRRDAPAIFTRATRVHCASEFVKRRLVRAGVDPDKVAVIPPVVDLEYFSPGPPRAGDPALRIVTAVGSGPSTQGAEHALMAIRRLKDAAFPVRLDMVGGCVGEERQRVLYTIHELDLQKDVPLWGPLGEDRLRSVLRASDVFLNVGLSEDISMTALSAMACGLPVVTGDSGGMPEVVEDGVEGLVVPAWDPEAMARTLADLGADAGRRQRMGASARARVASHATAAVADLLTLCEDAARSLA